MRKFKPIFVAAALLIMVFVIAGCTANSGYKLELNKSACASFYDEEADAYSFVQGSIDWSVFSFHVYDASGSVVDNVTVTESMLSSVDLVKVSVPGTNTITISYQGAKLYLTIKITPREEITYYSVTFNAGKGYFYGKENESYNDANGNTLYRTEYANGIIDVLEQPMRDGYDFVGWYTSDNFVGNKIVSPYQTSRNLVLYAKWSDQRKYSIQYISYLEGVYDSQVALYDGIEHGTEVNLISAPTKTGYKFKGYYILKDGEQFNAQTSTFIPAESESLKITLESNVTVRLHYEIKNVKLTFVSENWDETDSVYGVDIVYKENVAVLNGGKYVSGGCYIVEVPYNTTLRVDEEPIPVFPEIVSADGYWVDVATNARPTYGKATEDMVIVAVYEIKKFSLYFFYDKDFSEPVVDNAGRQVTRTAEYGKTVETLPVVPDLLGHTGVWVILDGTSFIETDLSKIAMTSDINVCIQYTPIDYTIKFIYRLPNIANEIVDSKTYPYGTAIEAPSLIEYYDEKHYSIEWYANRNLDNLIDHTSITVRGDASYYFKSVENDYKVNFVAAVAIDDTNYDIVYNREYTVRPGNFVIPPEINFAEDSPLFGYEIYGWRTRKNLTAYDSEATYAVGDFVLYGNRVYMYKKVSPNRIAPDEFGASEFWQSAQESSWTLYTDIGPNGLEVTDFHEYSEDILQDKAFYAVLRLKEYNVSFVNMRILGNASAGYSKDFYSLNEERILSHGNRVISDIADIEATIAQSGHKPSYPDGAIGQFVFDGWYIDPDFNTMKVDFTNPYYFRSDVIFYAKWSDKLRGTEGLEYKYVAEGDGYYVVTGFRPEIPEFSYIEMRIPATYDGKPVKSIADGAFNDFGKIIYITSVALGANIEYIGDNAFASLFSLESFVVEDNSRFVYSDGVLYSADYKTLYRVVPTHTGNAFDLPDEVEIVNGGAFAYCKQLNTLRATNASSLRKIGAYAFAGCSGLSNVFIPDTVVEIGAYAFRGCYNITSLTGGRDLLKVGDGVFNSIIDILPRTEQYIYFGNVMIKFIGTDSHVLLDSRITALAAGAFADYDNLITFMAASDSSLKYIGEHAFHGSFVLNSITFEGSDKMEAALNAFDKISLSCILYVNASLVDDYKYDAAYVSAFTAENLIVPL